LFDEESDKISSPKIMKQITWNAHEGGVILPQDEDLMNILFGSDKISKESDIDE